MSNPSDPFSILNKNPNRGIWQVNKKIEVKPIFRKGIKPTNAIDDDEIESDYNIFDESEPEIENDKNLKLKNNSYKTNNKNESLEIKNEIEIPEKTKPFLIETAQHVRIIPKDNISESGECESFEENEYLSNKEENSSKEENELIKEKEESSKDQNSSENNSEISEDENKLYKPEFVSKENRKSKNKLILENNKIDRNRKIKRETAVFLKNAKNMINNIDENEKNEEADIGDIDLDEEDELEFEKWRIREITRLKRDELEKREQENLQFETQRRKKMNDEELQEENKRIGKNADCLKSDYKYMQKYYTSFSFFQNSEDPVFQRDYNIATGFDTFDKSAAPTIMQARGNEFGKKGKSKYKDLVSEDTNVFERSWRDNTFLSTKMRQKQAGYKSFGESLKRKH